jgi:hypothetical protein
MVLFTAFGLFILSVCGSFTPLYAAILSDAEKEDLIFMREEEKLARDVYLTLHDAWKLRIFSNIAASEQTHMDAIMGLLVRYGIPDPAAGKEIGKFTNQELQDLYLELVDNGIDSLIGALEVGVTIEEKDIEDLQDALGITHHDVIRVYTNLINGSYNHLKAFTNQLASFGSISEP